MSRRILLPLLLLAVLVAGCSELNEDPGALPTHRTAPTPGAEGVFLCDAVPGPDDKAMADISNMLILMVNFHDTDIEYRLTAEEEGVEIDETLFSGNDCVADLYREMSFLQQDISGTVAGPYDLVEHSQDDPCEYHEDVDGDGFRNYLLWNDAALGLASDDYDIESFGAIIFVYPQNTVCYTTQYGGMDQIGGWGIIGGDIVTMYLWGDPGNWAHEIGHLAGWGHSWIDEAGGGNDYGCLMSPSSWRQGGYIPLRQIGSPWKTKADWYDDFREVRIETPGTHTVHLAPTERAARDIVDPPTGPAVHQVTFNAGGTGLPGDEIHLSYRNSEGTFDSNPYFAEVFDRVHVHQGTGSVRVALLDDQPGGDQYAGDICDVEVLALNENYATVRVTLSEPAPTVAMEPTQQFFGPHTPGRAACHFDLTVTNNGVAGSPDVTYALEPTPGDGYHLVPKKNQITLAPGDSHTLKVAFVPDVPLDSGTYVAEMTARDIMGHQPPVSDLSICWVDVTLPEAPVNLVAVADCASVELDWDAPENEPFGIASYDVERDGVVIGTAEASAFTDDTVQPRSTYTYRVRGTDTFGNPPGAWSDAVLVSTACGEGVITSVAQPTLYIDYVRPGTPISRTFDVAVTNLDDPGCEPVVMMVSEHVSGPPFNANPQAPTPVAIEPGATGTAHPSAFFGMDPVDGTYVMRTDFLNEVDPDAVSASEILTVVIDTQAPAAPAGLDAELTGATTARITWNAASDATSGVAYYEIERNGVIHATTTITEYDDPDVSMTARYDYRVRAVDAAGHASGWSNADFVGCAKCPPPVES